MAHGLPVIVAEGDGSQADLVQPDNGWLLQRGDEAALRAALRAALQEPQRLGEMGLISFQRVQEAYNLENMVGAFVSALNAVKR
jgi:glycosyltransferase involved in cell wall biosynthesis